MNNIKIELYKPQYKDDFISLNTEWITQFFRLEEFDLHALNHVEEYILNTGGQVFFAIQNDVVIGCCALIHHPKDNTYELAKMAVSPSAQGLGAGRILGEASLDYARKEGIKQVFLEGNTTMTASIILYKKLGFIEVPIEKPAYERCNIMMICDL